jgi:hypothetical protein
MTPNTIEFKTTNNTLMDGWVMRITADRHIEVNEDVEVTEAAKKVLEAMQLMLDKQKCAWVGLTDEEMLMLEETTTCTKDESWLRNLTRTIEAKLKEKNT